MNITCAYWKFSEGGRQVKLGCKMDICM